jgi:NAD(P)-dependent dehydrogenase (short-subunit alcohol dehydrogenase family)
MANWTVSDIPHQRGRSAVVTGAAGLGFEDALALARAGAEVILASRDPAKGTRAVEAIHRAVPSADVRFEALDLASLASVATFAERLRGQRDSLDILINNAGVMRPPQRMETADGFELQLGTNHLGHFALTAGLMPLLVKARKARVVTLSSLAARGGAIEFEDLQSTRRYRSMAAYSQSKLACLMFAFELQRRSEAGNWGVASLAAHPGLSRTELLLNAPGAKGRINPLFALFRQTMQPASQGALPTLFAATAPEARPGGYYGPDRMSETRGYPAPSRVPPRAADTAVAERLWHVSERLTGVRFPAAA